MSIYLDSNLLKTEQTVLLLTPFRGVPIKTERVFCLWTAIQPKNLIIFKTAESKLLF